MLSFCDSHEGFCVELFHKEKESIIKSDTCPFDCWKISGKCVVLIYKCIRGKRKEKKRKEKGGEKKKQQNYNGT